MAAQVTLAQLTAGKTRDQIYAELLAGLQTNGFPTTDWADGGADKTMVQIFATALADLSGKMLPNIAFGGFVNYDTGDWLTVLAHEVYELDRNLATNTLGNIQLYCAAGAGPYTIQPGTLFFLGQTGNSYFNTGYLDGTGTFQIGAVVLRAPGFSAVTHSGGVGTVTPSGANSGGLSIVVKIVLAGGRNAGKFTISRDNGTTYDAAQTLIPVAGVYTDALTGITITFSNDNFLLNDLYSFQSYGLVTLRLQSESPNNSTAVPPLNYTDPAQSITQMVTPLAGVTCSNVSADYSKVVHTGNGTGTIALTRTNPAAPPSACSVTLRIDVAGDPGVASWSYNLNNAGYVSAGAVASFDIPGVNIHVQLNAGSSSPGFLLGDTYLVRAPGSWIVQQGQDQESDASLKLRCKARWPALAVVPTLSKYTLWVLAASTQITQVLPQTDGTVNNKVNLYIAGQAGAVGQYVVNQMHAYLNSVTDLTDFPNVVSATNRAVSLAAGVTVKVKAAQLATAKPLVQAAIAALMNGVGINGKLYLSQLIDAIMNVPGMIDVLGLTITGANADTNTNLQLPVTPGAVEVTQWTQDVTTLWTWTGI